MPRFSWRAVALGLAVGLALPPLLFASFLLAARAVAAPAGAEPGYPAPDDPPMVLAYGRDDAGAARRPPSEAARRRVSLAGSVTSDLHQAAADHGVPAAVLTQLHRVLAHAVDLQRDIRPGDSFRLGYETAGDGQQGRLLFLWLHLRERTLAVYRHTTADGFTGYFDRDGHSAEGAMLKTPVEGGRLSSAFGMRRHPILGYSRMHRGLDFAAAPGTPVLAAGDGVIARRGRNGGYGNYLRIDHGGGHATAYGHLSAYAGGLAEGDAVRQGQVIGYVGASGLATGPHLHYEVLVGDAQVDPRSVVMPPQRVLAGADVDRFRVERIRMMVVLHRNGEAAEEPQSAAIP